VGSDATEIEAKRLFHTSTNLAVQRLATTARALDGLLHRWRNSRLAVGLATESQLPLHLAVAKRALQAEQPTGEARRVWLRNRETRLPLRV
jgi:hypothetical protein